MNSVLYPALGMA